MIRCKKCESVNVVKNGIIRDEQRYKCKECGCNFELDDKRTSEEIIAIKALCVLFSLLEKGSYSKLGELFGRDRALIYRWIRKAGLNPEKPLRENEVHQIGFDKISEYINSSKRYFCTSKPLAIAGGKLSPEYSVVVIVQHTGEEDTLNK